MTFWCGALPPAHVRVYMPAVPADAASFSSQLVSTSWSCCAEQEQDDERGHLAVNKWLC